ncbi:GOLPH3/VPS74 family protein [Streptomyces sp. SBT349]|uniref:GOLPH3/VPS74 family protein n=1 Tax=Streptomyces sp. SBT349 TaxID=1580539 RepID=UPI00066BACC0|nr:GPP34 family phosphoprotein [Streptomyces sp. SBT349]
MVVTLGEEVMLLSLDDASGQARKRQSAGWAVAGATLLELALAGRVSIADGRVAVVDRSPTGVPLLDGRLQRLAEWTADAKRGRKAADWVAKDQGKAVEAAIGSLCARRLVHEESHRALGLFPVRRYPEADGSVERELRERLTAAVLGGERPDDRTSGLVAVLHAARLDGLAFPDVPRERIESRLAEIAEGQWAGRSVRDAIRAMQMVMTTITVVTVVTTMS